MAYILPYHRSLAKVAPTSSLSRIETGKYLKTNLFHTPCGSSYLISLTEVFTINCTARELKDVPTSGQVFEADALLLADNKISYLDFSFLKNFPSLKALIIRKNGLKSLTKSGRIFQENDN